VVGYSYTVLPTNDFSPRHAFSWTAQEGMIDLGTLGGSYSFAFDVNDHGQVVGSSTTAGDGTGEGAARAVLWQRIPPS
jgi:probable HAF family extracellular repeat protein